MPCASATIFRLAPLHYNTIVDNTSRREGHRVIVVDTSSINDAYEDWRRNFATHCRLAGIIVSIYILSELLTSLTRWYGANMKLGRVIYLLSIADKRMEVVTRRNLDRFHQLCRNKAFARVVLGDYKLGRGWRGSTSTTVSIRVSFTYRSFIHISYDSSNPDHQYRSQNVFTSTSGARRLSITLPNVSCLFPFPRGLSMFF